MDPLNQSPQLLSTALIAFAVNTLGCALNSDPTVEIHSVPMGARVHIEPDGIDVTTPASVSLPPRQTRLLRFELEGYEPHETDVRWYPAALGARTLAPSSIRPRLLRSEDAAKEEEWTGAKTMTAAEVNASTGLEAERWRVPTEKEYVDNFVQRNVYTVARPEDVRRCGPPLPMKCVYTTKTPSICKVRAVVCGNYERADPSQALWTAQADTSSLISAFR